MAISRTTFFFSFYFFVVSLFPSEATEQEQSPLSSSTNTSQSHYTRDELEAFTEKEMKASEQCPIKRVHSKPDLESSATPPSKVFLRSTHDDDEEPTRVNRVVSSAVGGQEASVGRKMEQKIRVNPERDEYGRNSLYIAIKNKMPIEKILSLFQGRPEDIYEPDICGESPLHLLYSKTSGENSTPVDPSILKAILFLYPSLAICRSGSFSGKRLVDSLFDSFNWLTMVNSDGQSGEKSSVGCSSAYWEKLILTLQAARRAMHSSNNFQAHHLPELHCALEVGLSASNLCFFVEIFPDQLMTPMTCRSNMLPIHFVLKTVKKQPLLRALIRRLITKIPALCEVQYGGEYPLHIAIKRGICWEDGMKDLVLASYTALHSRDKTTHLLPFQLASMHCDLNTIYHILNENPSILPDFHTM